MILVCGAASDGVIDYVRTQAEVAGCDHRFVDLNAYPLGYRLAWRWGADGPSGYLASQDWSVDLAELSGVYVRYPGPEDQRVTSDLSLDRARAAAEEALLGLSTLVDQLPCTVVNRQAAGLSNSSKTYQAQIIRRSGLRTPPTLVTTDPADARHFYLAHESQVIYKALSNWPSVVRRFEPGHFARLPLLRYAPVQFQALIPGHEVRVHTVGCDRVFATLVQSDAVDYRLAVEDGASLNMVATVLPAEVAGACLKLSRTLGLQFAGIDLRVSPDNEWYCFEVNPSPGFTFFEGRTEQPIARALVSLLQPQPEAQHLAKDQSDLGGVQQPKPTAATPDPPAPTATSPSVANTAQPQMAVGGMPSTVTATTITLPDGTTVTVTITTTSPGGPKPRDSMQGVIKKPRDKSESLLKPRDGALSVTKPRDGKPSVIKPRDSMLSMATDTDLVDLIQYHLDAADNPPAT